MRWLTPAILGVALVAGSVTASAQNAASLPPASSAQGVANPGPTYPPSQFLGPNASSGASAPVTPSSERAESAGSRNDNGNFYSRKGFGPAPN
jgi:hypothetical protein